MINFKSCIRYKSDNQSPSGKSSSRERKPNLSSSTLVCSNKKAKFEYFLKEYFTAGIVLLGTEIKSIRASSCSIDQAIISFIKNEAYIEGMNIPIYKNGNIFNHEPTRSRKLLLNKKEILYLSEFIKTHPHYYVVPLKVFFNNGRIKIEIALAESKRLSDKRETIKQREAERDIKRAEKRKY